MLSCDDVKALLPGLVTGEKTSHETREHLAKCDDCRAERDRLAREVEGMREDLAALAPSPFLEDAVLEAAQVEAGSAPARRPWPYVAAAFVAVAALFLVVLLPRLRERGGGEAPTPIPSEEGEGGDRAPGLPRGAARLYVPPSRGEVEEARQGNSRSMNLRAATAGPDEMDYDTWPDGASTDRETTIRFLPPAEGVRQRYVYGDANGRSGDVVHTMATLPSVEGVFHLGNGLLEQIGGTLHAGRTGEILVGDKRWETTPGTMQGEIDVASPDVGGAEARVRVLVSTGYSGTLLLEEPLAYALGLNQFEIPGPVRFTNPDGDAIPVRGWRARARVRIPELDFDRVVEVQVVRARPWMVKRGRRARETGVLFRGELPRSLLHAREFEFDPETGGYDLDGDIQVYKPEERGGKPIRQVEIGEGAFRLLIGFAPPGPASLPAVPDVPLLGELFDVPYAVLIPRALDFGPSTLHVIDIGRVALNGAWEPGAKVTLARVWRGRTAIPSAEAVVQTEVGKNGRITFPRIAGEKGSTLRMLVTKKDGTATFHDVVVAPELRTRPRLEMELGPDGEVRAPGWAVTLFEGVWRGDQEAGTAVPQRFATLVALLHRRVAGEGVRDDEGNSKMELVLRAHPDAPWRMVQWVLAAAADPGVRAPRFRLGRTDAKEDALLSYELPTDGGVHADPSPDAAPEKTPLTVHLMRNEPGEPLRMVVDGLEDVGLPLTPESFAHDIRDLLSVYRRRDLPIGGVLKVPSPGLVTCLEAVNVLEILMAAGVEDVRFEGAPPR